MQPILLLFLASLFVGTNGLTTTSPETISAMSLTSTLSTSLVTASTSTTPIPQIIADWNGLRKPNYTDLHVQFTVPLQCGFLAVPTGVFGFYSWILTLVMIYCSYVSSTDETRGGCSRAASHILTLTFFGVMLALRIAGANICTKRIPESLDRPKRWDQSENKWVKDTVTGNDYGIAWFAMTAFIAFASWHFIISKERPEAGIGALMFMTLLAVFVPAMFYNSYANFLYIDGSLWQQIITVSIPIAVFFGIMLCLSFAKVRKNSYEWVRKRKWTKTRISWTMVVCIFGLGMLFHFWAIGMSFIILGRTINDPWGIKTVWNNFGQIMLALHGVLVPAALYNALFGGGA